MNTETRWKWFKRFITLITLVAGVLTGISIFQQDLTLFAVSIILLLVTIQFQIMIGFTDALENDQGFAPNCPKCGKPMKLKFFPRLGPPGNVWVCDCDE